MYIPTLQCAGETLSDSVAREIRSTVADNGYVYVTGIQSGFDHVAEIGRIGEVAPQYQGTTIRDVTPEPDMEHAQISANNMKALSPHTESFEFDGLPPRYVVLWCIRPAEGSGGETTIADGAEFLDSFGGEDHQIMRTRVYEWRSPASLSLRDISMTAHHPILEEVPEGLVMRYSSREMYEFEELEDGLLRRYVDDGIVFFEQNHAAIPIARNAMLIWDNWRMIHSRNAFTDPRRHLRRMLLDRWSS